MVSFASVFFFLFFFFLFSRLGNRGHSKEISLKPSLFVSISDTHDFEFLGSAFESGAGPRAPSCMCAHAQNGTRAFSRRVVRDKRRLASFKMCVLFFCFFQQPTKTKCIQSMVSARLSVETHHFNETFRFCCAPLFVLFGFFSFSTAEQGLMLRADSKTPTQHLQKRY